MLTQPPLTQSLGPWLGPLPGKHVRQQELEKDLMTELIAKLPRFDAFRQGFSPQVTNWLPFYWAGFRATVLYTYRLEDVSDLDAVWSGFAPNLRTKIRKAEKSLEVRTDLGLDVLLELHEQVFRRQGLRPSVSSETVRRVEQACRARGLRRLSFAVDAQDRVHVASFVLHDDRTNYLLLNGADPELRNSGGQALLDWTTIRTASEAGRSVDFMGSMLESVERYIRGFGARRVPYLFVSRTRPHIRPLMEMRDLVGTLRARRHREPA